MPAISLSQLVPILQLSIGPVILISGMGLLLLTLTNRFGRMIDRARLLNDEMTADKESPKTGELRAQIKILLRRASILRLAIILGTITVLLSGLLVLLLFLSALLHLEVGFLIVVVFCSAMLALLGSMLAFIQDTNLALSAVRHEVRL